MEADRSEKARGLKSDMDVGGESHSFIVPKKPANKGRVPRPAELVEGRELTKENTEQPLLGRTQRRNSDGTPFIARSRGLLGVHEAARRDKKQKFTSLLHHLTADLLRASFFELKKQAAPGIEALRACRRSPGLPLHFPSPPILPLRSVSPSPTPSTIPGPLH